MKEFNFTKKKEKIWKEFNNCELNGYELKEKLEKIDKEFIKLIEKAFNDWWKTPTTDYTFKERLDKFTDNTGGTKG